MPYIDSRRRLRIDSGERPQTPGELNYRITRLLQTYIDVTKGGVSYTNINEVIGVLECVKLELYRRMSAPYEDKKIEENGDVY